MPKFSKSRPIIGLSSAFASVFALWGTALGAQPAPESLPECSGCITPKAVRAPAAAQEAPPLCESCISPSQNITPATRSDFPE